MCMGAFSRQHGIVGLALAGSLYGGLRLCRWAACSAGAGARIIYNTLSVVVLAITASGHEFELGVLSILRNPLISGSRQHSFGLWRYSWPEWPADFSRIFAPS